MSSLGSITGLVVRPRSLMKFSKELKFQEIAGGTHPGHLLHDLHPPITTSSRIECPHGIGVVHPLRSAENTARTSVTKGNALIGDIDYPLSFP